MSYHVERVCPICGEGFTAKIFDVRRGWGVYNNKKCAAIGRERKKQRRQRHGNYLPKRKSNND